VRALPREIQGLRPRGLREDAIQGAVRETRVVAPVSCANRLPRKSRLCASGQLSQEGSHRLRPVRHVLVCRRWRDDHRGRSQPITHVLTHRGDFFSTASHCGTYAGKSQARDPCQHPPATHLAAKSSTIDAAPVKSGREAVMLNFRNAAVDMGHVG
jgi:hypothetical protein